MCWQRQPPLSQKGTRELATPTLCSAGLLRVLPPGPEQVGGCQAAAWGSDQSEGLLGEGARPAHLEAMQAGFTFPVPKPLLC